LCGLPTSLLLPGIGRSVYRLYRLDLLVEAKAVDPVRVAQYLHRASGCLMKNIRCHAKVVLDQVALGQPRLGKEHLVRVGEADVTAADPHEKRDSPLW